MPIAFNDPTVFFFASLFFIGLLLFIVLLTRYLLAEKSYDERQQLLAYKSYKYSALIALGWCLFFNAVRLEVYTITQTIFFTSIAANLSFRILNHSLAPRGKSNTTLIVVTSLLVVTMPVYTYLASQIQAIPFEDWFNVLVLFGSFVSILMAMLIRRHRDQQEESDA